MSGAPQTPSPIVWESVRRHAEAAAAALHASVETLHQIDRLEPSLQLGQILRRLCLAADHLDIKISRANARAKDQEP